MRSDWTIGQVIEDAIQLAFRSIRTDTPIAPLPVYGGGGVMPGVDLTSNRFRSLRWAHPLDADGA